MEKKRVLVVDDEENFLKMVKLNLEQTGKYEVMTLSAAKDIISCVYTFRPDVILLDLLMPGIGGIEACEMLNDDSLGRTIPIIVLSALEKDRDKLKAYKVGVVDYLIKPLEVDAIAVSIEKALRYKGGG